MKIWTLRTIIAVSACATALPLAANQATVDSLKKDFTGVRALELPARVASAVSAAKPADRQETAQDAIRAALAVNASSASMVVGAVARANQDVAAVSAVTAASIEPKELPKIARAAVGAAPSEVENIVTALAKAQPAAFQNIGLAAAHVAPGSGAAILRGLSEATPALKTLIARATPKGASLKDSYTVAAILRHAQEMAATLSKDGNVDTMLAGSLSPETVAKLPGAVAVMPAGGVAFSAPTVGPPYTPNVGGGGEITPANTFNAPPGGRIYSPP